MTGEEDTRQPRGGWSPALEGPPSRCLSLNRPRNLPADSTWRGGSTCPPAGLRVPLCLSGAPPPTAPLLPGAAGQGVCPPPGGGAAWHRGPEGSRTGDARPPRHRQQGQAQRQGPTFFLSSTLMALASLRKMALPHSRSRRDVNWYHFHFRKAHSASSHSLSVHWTAGRGARGHHGAGHSVRRSPVAR